MLFNSAPFLLLYLPITLAGFFWLGARSRHAAAWWLAGASLVFYAGWSWRYVPLLLLSVSFNFAAALLIGKTRARPRMANALLTLAIGANLLLLGWFKYADFLIANWNLLSGQRVGLLHLLLPLGISFFTFTQIAFLIDTRKDEASEPRFSHYLLFVTYFPHLIAGPILHHREMMPQFKAAAIYRFQWSDIAVGTAIFAIGLFKKTVLADGAAPHVASAFQAAAAGESIHLLRAWGAALAYTMQLYFDFSGYSDMAIGLSRLIGVRLPLNFASPYKARNISEFWRRWHMTLSRFLRDYLYIPLGGNRHGVGRRYLSLLATMFLGGLWHGAAWTFAVWGLLHGAFLATHHAFHALAVRLPALALPKPIGTALSVGLTYLAVVIGWVFFRADSIDAALQLMRGMAGANGLALPDAIVIRLPAGARELLATAGIRSELGGGTEFVVLWTKLLALHIMVFALPNTQEVMRRFDPALGFKAPDPHVRWSASLDARWALGFGVLAAFGLMAMTQHSAFLYYQF